MNWFAHLLAQVSQPLSSNANAAGTNAYGWKPFLTAMPVWDYWPLLLLPLCLCVALVYKTTKCEHATGVPKEAGILTLWIVLGLVAAAAAVTVVVRMN